MAQEATAVELTIISKGPKLPKNNLRIILPIEAICRISLKRSGLIRYSTAHGFRLKAGPDGFLGHLLKDAYG